MSGDRVRARVAARIGAPIESVVRIGGGHGAEVYRVRLADGGRLVAKLDVAGGAARLDCEARMIAVLASRTALPVPRLIASAADCVLMEDLAGAPAAPGRSAERHAAELLAALHDITAPGYGFEEETVIAGLSQPNDWSNDWVGFFRDRRLLHMADLAHGAGALPTAIRHRLDALAGRLGQWLLAPEAPALIHGDLWGGNVLVDGDRIAGFIDPALYFADPEIELAFITLFNTFGTVFFERYRQLRPIKDGFFEDRRDLYNLYPLLVHVCLFGGHYVGEVDRTLRRFGV